MEIEQASKDRQRWTRFLWEEDDSFSWGQGIRKRDKEVEQEAAFNSDFEKYIMIIMASAKKGKDSATISASANVSDSKTHSVTINSILKRAATWHTQDKSEEDGNCKIRGLQVNPKVYEMISKTDRGDLDVDAMETDGKSRT